MGAEELSLTILLVWTSAGSNQGNNLYFNSIQVGYTSDRLRRISFTDIWTQRQRRAFLEDDRTNTTIDRVREDPNNYWNWYMIDGAREGSRTLMGTSRFNFVDGDNVDGWKFQSAQNNNYYLGVEEDRERKTGKSSDRLHRVMLRNFSSLHRLRLQRHSPEKPCGQPSIFPSAVMPASMYRWRTAK